MGGGAACGCVLAVPHKGHFQPRGGARFPKRHSRERRQRRPGGSLSAPHGARSRSLGFIPASRFGRLKNTSLSRVRTTDLARKKAAGEKIPVLTAYDATMAILLEQAGMDVI